MIDMEWALGMSDESGAEDSVDRDPDWVKTPRIRQQRRSERRTRSTEGTSLSIANNSGQVKVLGVEHVNCWTVGNWSQLLESTIFCMRMMYYSVNDKGILGKRKFRVLLSGVEPKTFRLLVQMLYH